MALATLRRQGSRQALLTALVGLAAAACTTAGPVIPDTTGRVPPPSLREGANANDVFLRKPWEMWRVPGGTARYHRQAFILLPDDSASFKAAEVSVYAADGSDVRVDYISVNLGTHAQSQESISVFVYRAPGPLDGEWPTVVERFQRKYPGARSAEPFPLPDKHPPSTKRLALVVPGPAGDPNDDRFTEVVLFHQGEWAVRYEITCQAGDVEAARGLTQAFLRSLREHE